MKSVNTVTLLGNVTQNPERKTPVRGQSVCTFGLATNRTWKDAKGAKQSQVEFHNLVAWGKLGELCGKYVKKGKPVYIEGHLKTGSWENAQGVTLHRTEVIIDNLILLGAKKGSPEIERAVVAEEGVVMA
ncbi:MAG: single-stranded DNA-binding protein [Candidatus Peregrinibacteria bacterium]|nr:single-stranded DNA-binding protein [Candidatus Peregrinibacteria bacterium]